MQRRDFIKLVTAGSALFAISPRLQAAQVEEAEVPWDSYRLTYQVDLPESGKKARLWLPMPDRVDTGHQLVHGDVWSGNATKAAFQTLPGASVPLFYAEWSGRAKTAGARSVTVSSIVKTTERRVDLGSYPRSVGALPQEVKKFMQPTLPVASLKLLRESSQAVIGAAQAVTPLEKARAIYDWVVENTRYDPLAKGVGQAAGQGEAAQFLKAGSLAGKSADINALFVSLARAAGIPAREHYGIRVDESKYFQCMGKLGDISRAQHCRAEFYLAGMGWIPVDPADVRKVMLEENLPSTDARVIALREKLFGAWEMNWVAFNQAREIKLAADSAVGRLPFFLYPHAEIDKQVQDSFDPARFSYQITSAELVGTGAKF